MPDPWEAGMLTDVVDAKVRKGLRVILKFVDGLTGEVDLGAHLVSEGVFAFMLDQSRFTELEVDKDLGTICRPNGADLTPRPFSPGRKRPFGPHLLGPQQSAPEDMPKASDALGTAHSK